MKKRVIISIGLFLSLIMLPITAIMIHSTHSNATSHTWLHVHVFCGLLFTIFGILHVVYNWQVLKRYILGRNN